MSVERAPIERTCRRCGETKPLEQFSKDKSCHFGRTYTCRACATARADKWRRENPDRVRENYRRRTGWTPPPTEPPAERECSRCGATKPFEEFRTDNSCRFGRGGVCKACESLNGAAWRANNRERARATKRKRRTDDYLGLSGSASEDNAARRGANVVERVLPLAVLERDDGVCGICGEDVDPFDFTLDHIEPVEVGGDHSYANVQVAHRACNSKKGHSLNWEPIGA